MTKTYCKFQFSQPGLSSSPWKAAKPLDTKDKFSPEPLAHQAVNIKVEAGVEDNEDMVEVSHTEPEAWDGMPASLVADRHSEILSLKQYSVHWWGFNLFSLRYLSMMNIS